jgi:2,4-dienoyl-CoA reductase-like NADH-dependent reductase (Old Yellow Enzyme family)
MFQCSFGWAITLSTVKIKARIVMSDQQKVVLQMNGKTFTLSNDGMYYSERARGEQNLIMTKYTCLQYFQPQECKNPANQDLLQILGRHRLNI